MKKNEKTGASGKASAVLFFPRVYYIMITLLYNKRRPPSRGFKKGGGLQGGVS